MYSDTKVFFINLILAGTAGCATRLGVLMKERECELLDEVDALKEFLSRTCLDGISVLAHDYMIDRPKQQQQHEQVSWSRIFLAGIKFMRTLMMQAKVSVKDSRTHCFRQTDERNQCVTRPRFSTMTNEAELMLQCTQ